MKFNVWRCGARAWTKMIDFGTAMYVYDSSIININYLIISSFPKTKSESIAIHAYCLELANLFALFLQ